MQQMFIRLNVLVHVLDEILPSARLAKLFEKVESQAVLAQHQRVSETHGLDKIELGEDVRQHVLLVFVEGVQLADCVDCVTDELVDADGEFVLARLVQVHATTLLLFVELQVGLLLHLLQTLLLQTLEFVRKFDYFFQRGFGGQLRIRGSGQHVIALAGN